MVTSNHIHFRKNVNWKMKMLYCLGEDIISPMYCMSLIRIAPFLKAKPRIPLSNNSFLDPTDQSLLLLRFCIAEKRKQFQMTKK